MATHPFYVRAARVAFWSGALIIAALLLVSFCAVVLWLLVVDWHVLGL